ncbi:MAG: helix-turn-helix domain-containing protein [Aeromicrobium sp.]
MSEPTTASDSDGSVAHARQQYLSTGSLPESTGVREAILRSWQRSRMHGVDPAGGRPAEPLDADPGNRLVGAARSAVEDRASWLTDLPHAIVVTDGEGRVLERWASDPSIIDVLDGLHVVPGFLQGEGEVGTSSVGIVLETGEDVQVSGDEHYRDGAVGLASAGSPVRHPSTHRTMGSVNVYSHLEHASPLMLALVHEVARSIEDLLLDGVSEREHALVQTYLENVADSAEPFICLNEHSVVGNAAAAARLDSLDQTLLWELAAQTVRTNMSSLTWIPLTDGSDNVAVACEPIQRDGRTVGAALRLMPLEPSGESVPDAAGRLLPRLVGRSWPWRRLCERIEQSLERRRPISLIGETGVGKSTIVAELVSDGTTRRLEAHPTGRDDEAWLAQVDEALVSDVDFVVVENLHLLGEPVLHATMASIRSHWNVHGPQVLVTWTRPPTVDFSPPRNEPRDNWAGDHHEVPALRHRLGDLSLLLGALGRARHPTQQRVDWAPDAVQALSRMPWPANLRSLSAFISALVAEVGSGPVRLADLPADVRAAATRRELGGLERLEARAITQALDAAGGNKKQAAELLGIARSTLYRRIESLGLDLGHTTY